MDEKRHRIHIVVGRTGRGTVEINGQAIDPGLIRRIAFTADARVSELPLVTLELVGDVIIDAATVLLDVDHGS